MVNLVKGDAVAITALAIVLTTTTASILASAAPPHYRYTIDQCQERPARGIRVCAVNYNDVMQGGRPILDIGYGGSSWAYNVMDTVQHGGQLFVRVKMNGKGWTDFKLYNSSQEQEFYTWKRPEMVKFYLPINDVRYMNYNSNEPPAEEQDLMFFAKDGRKMNAWDVEFAFYAMDNDNKKVWDNNGGNNYHMRFEVDDPPKWTPY